MWDRKTDPAPEADRSPSRAPSPPAGRVSIGQSIVVKGELSGSEDLNIDGQVEGVVSLKENNLIIGPQGRIQAEVNARTVTILGRVQGNVHATERVEIQTGGRLEGDIRAPRIAISEGAHFRGKVDMETSKAAARASAVGEGS